jgi:nucleoside-diphosphate-sugar epimerase
MNTKKAAKTSIIHPGRIRAGRTPTPSIGVSGTALGIWSGRIPRKLRRIKLLVVGAGDVGLRLIRAVNSQYGDRVLVMGTTRRHEQARAVRDAGALPLAVDLDRRDSVQRLHGLARWMVHLAPPPPDGMEDTRSRRLVATAAKGFGATTRRWVYASTSGVYGDCQGRRIDETEPVRPKNARAVRRVSGETILRNAARSGRGTATRLAILRVPGIYDSAARLPLERLEKNLPALVPEQDTYTNHIHAQDLATICWLGLFRASGGRIVHATDNSEMKMGEYFDAVADALGRPRPPRLPRGSIEASLSPAMLSFLNESRRLMNRRLCIEWGYRLRYPTVADTLARL